MELQILELFSGIGGMHYAFEYSKLSGSVVAAFDINTIANEVYSHNHPKTIVKNNNIQNLNLKTIKSLGVNTILMSPPCQPHTRVGKQLDIEDNRSDALQHICKLLPDLPEISYVLMENVKNFEKSRARQCFVNALELAGFYYCEFILSPKQFFIPNSRHRYYCLARKDKKYPFPTEYIQEKFPHTFIQKEVFLSDILEPKSTNLNEYLLSNKNLLKRVWLMDIVTAEDKSTNCFTKAYTHFAEGTGSVYAPLQRAEADEILKKLKKLEATSTATDDERLQLLKLLRLRYFSPREVARLMCFPESFDFPITITNRQKYRLLGNSINVLVVSELIKLLCS